MKKILLFVFCLVFCASAAYSAPVSAKTPRKADRPTKQKPVKEKRAEVPETIVEETITAVSNDNAVIAQETIIYAETVPAQTAGLNETEISSSQSPQVAQQPAEVTASLSQTATPVEPAVLEAKEIKAPAVRPVATEKRESTGKQPPKEVKDSVTKFTGSSAITTDDTEGYIEAHTSDDGSGILIFEVTEDTVPVTKEVKEVKKETRKIDDRNLSKPIQADTVTDSDFDAAAFLLGN
jgi:hypothetical protein